MLSLLALQFSAVSDSPRRQHRIDVDKILKPKGNILAITIKPAVPEALKRKEAYPYAVPFVQVNHSPSPSPVSFCMTLPMGNPKQGWLSEHYLSTWPRATVVL